MNAIDNAIVASLTMNRELNRIIASMPAIADNPEFVSKLAAALVKDNGITAKWKGTDAAVMLLKSARATDNAGVHNAMQKTYLYSTLNPLCGFDHSELFVLAVERLAAEPDSAHAPIWLSVAATMLRTVLIDNDCELPF